jgi:GxxExxY protein
VPESSSSLLHGDLTEVVLGGFYDVYNQVGAGFLEMVYENAMAIELKAAGLAVQRQCEVPVFFKGHLVGRYIADLILEDKVVLELKACRQISPIHEAQVINLLKATRLEVGLLLNFGSSPTFKRVVFSNTRKVLPAQIPTREELADRLRVIRSRWLNE